jgi:uncharacterized protein (DUF362 family)
MVQAMTPESGVITHPVVVQAVINILRDYGIRQITIAEAPALGIKASKAFAIGKYKELAEVANVRLLDLMDAPRTQVHVGYGYQNVPNVFEDANLANYFCGYLSIPNVFLESDLYINVPKMKTHNRTTVTLSMKNQWGILSFKDRQAYHRIGLHEPITHLARAVKPHMTVVDAVVGLEGNGPILGKPVAVGAMLVGKSMVETDIVGSLLMGQDPRDVLHINKAVEMGLGEWVVDVHGERIDDLAVKFQPAPQQVNRNYNFYLWRNHRACHLDDDAFLRAAKVARRNPRYWMYFVKLYYYSLFRRIDVIRGRGMSMPEFKPGQKIIISGDCAREVLDNYEDIPKNVIHIPGCPPKPEDIIKAIIRM